MKIAILSSGNLDDMKGVMNYVHEEVIQFKKCNRQDIAVDNFFIYTVYTGILGFLYKTRTHKYVDGQIVINNGVEYHIIIREYGLYEIFSTFILRRFISRRFAQKVADFTSSYDVISAHQLPCISAAKYVKDISGKPYIATWHGSDINITPRESHRLYEATKIAIEAADMNFFVSKALMRTSEYITVKGNKTHIYTGPSDSFKIKSDDRRKELRCKYDVEQTKVVLFAGNLIPIKNVTILPDIFALLSKKLPDMNIKYWIVGDGEQQQELIKKLDISGVNYRFFGKVTPSEMPDMMNCADVLVLPSLNEGFPLVVLEARACGCNVVGSRVGGIPESAGIENTFDLNDSFVENITERMKEMLLNGEAPCPLNEECSWKFAVLKELKVMENICETEKNNTRQSRLN